MLASLLVAALQMPSEPERLPGITYVEQPAGIELTQYVGAWPALEPLVARLQRQDVAGVEADLLTMASPSPGALNLLSQLQRKAGKLDQAEASIDRAIAAEPNQHLHYFQRAMIFFTHLQLSSGQLEKWKWHSKTKADYAKAFALEPKGISYRYYLAYAYLQEPRLVGGNKDEGLRLAQQGIDLGQNEFYVVRADAHRLRGEVAAAFADYDASMRLNLFKLKAFVGAGNLALEQKDIDRAKRYFDYAVRCRPDSPMSYEGLGDYYAAVHDAQAATRAYETALQKDPSYAAARDKLGKIKRSA